MKKVKIGMISFAHMHAASYLEELMKLADVEIIGIADDRKARVEPFLEKYALPYYSDHLALLSEDLDAVIICSENILHAQLTLDAATAGKHILCEKPLGINREEMKQMIEACHKLNVQLMTAFPCRYLPSVIEARAAVERGEIGEILAMKGTNRGMFPGGWFTKKKLSGGGAVLDHTVHVIDLMNWILGSKVQEVYAEVATLFHDSSIDDAGMVHVTFENGVTAVLDPSWSRPQAFPIWGDVTLEIIGTKGILSIDAFGAKNDLYSNQQTKALWSYYGENIDEAMIKDFVHAIQTGQPVSINGEDGLLSATVALAAYDSAKLGRPVRIQW